METDCRKIKSILRQLKSRISVLHKSLQKAPSKSNTNQVSQLTFKQLKKTIKRDSWEATCNVSSPSRRHIFNLKDHFQEQIDRVLVPNQTFPSLLQLASQAMGKVAIHVDDIELEDFYDMIPDHCRRWVLSQHMIQILLKDVPLSALLPGLADICIDAGAEEQVIVFNKAFQLLCGFWLRRNKFRREDYQWAIKKMKSICRSSAWASFLSMYLMDNGPSVRLYQSIDSPDFSLEVAFKVICGYIEIETKDLSALEETISFLVKYSFDYNTTNSRFRDCINLLLSNPFSSLERLKSEVMFNFGLLVVSLLSEDRELKSIFALLNQSLTKTMVYDAVSQYAWNSSQLYQTGCLAQTNGYPDLAINVFICAVNLAREEQETEVLNFVPDLESRILDLQANHKPQTSWKYEPLLDSWIAETPKPLPTQSNAVNSTPVPKRLSNITSSPELSSDSEHEIDMDNFVRPRPYKRKIFDFDEKENSYPSKKPKEARPMKRQILLTSETDPEDDPLTAPGTVERLKRALQERIRIARTPMKAKRSIAMIWSSPVLQTTKYFENETVPEDDEMVSEEERLSEGDELDDLLM